MKNTMLLSLSSYSSRILKQFEMEMAKDRVDNDGPEYQGSVSGTSVERGRAQGREKVSLQVPDWELALSKYSHPIGY